MQLKRHDREDFEIISAGAYDLVPIVDHPDYRPSSNDGELLSIPPAFKEGAPPLETRGPNDVYQYTVAIRYRAVFG